MASYESLSFQLDLFKQELFAIYDSALNEAVEYVERNFKPDGGTRGTPLYTENGKEITVQANSLMAWVLEYGAGIKADTQRNPYWDEYLKSGLTSARRRSGRIVQRSGVYQTLNLDDNGTIITRRSGGREGSYIPDTGDEYQVTQEKVARDPEPFLQDMLQQAYAIFEEKAYSLSQNINPNKFFIKSMVNV